MATETSPPAPRRPAKVLSAVLAYGFLLALFGMLLGLLVGFAILASVGVSSAVQHVIGVMLLTVSALAALAALVFLGFRLGAQRAARAPRRQLAVFLAPQGRGFDVAGTIASPPTYLAPLSQRTCVVCYIALQHFQAVDEGSDTVEWVTLWAQPRTSDLTIGYDRTRTVDSRPHALRGGQPTVTDAPGGTITVPGDLIRMTLLPAERRRMRIFPPTAASLQILDSVGLPAKLHEASAALPDSYRVVEFCLTTGDFVRGNQQATLTTEQWMPDPTVTFQMSTLSQEQIGTQMTGCLALVFFVGMLLLLLFGVLLLQR